MEEFRKINNHPNFSVTNLGNIRNDVTQKLIKQRLSKNGYLHIYIEGHNYRVNRLVAIAFIQNPENKSFVDHIDNNRVNNNVTNLRWVTRQENQFNRKVNKDSISGIKGVTYNKLFKKWMARIKIEGKQKIIGYYDTIEEATKARQDFANKIFGEYTNQCEKIAG